LFFLDTTFVYWVKLNTPLYNKPERRRFDSLIIYVGLQTASFNHFIFCVAVIKKISMFKNKHYRNIPENHSVKELF